MEQQYWFRDTASWSAKPQGKQKRFLGGKLFGLAFRSLCFVGSNSEVHYDNLQNRLGLPYVRNFPDMNRISLWNFVSGNSFKEYCTLIPETLKIILNKQQKWGNDEEKLRLIKTFFFKGYAGRCVGMFYNVIIPTVVYRSSHPQLQAVVPQAHIFFKLNKSSHIR